MKYILLALTVWLAAPALQAQVITHGPVVGGVTPTSARMYVRTNQAMPIEIELSTDSLFQTVITILDTTVATNDSTCIADISGLAAYTTYYYRVKANGITDTITGHFKTFPNPGERGQYDWVVLSCQEYGTYNTFDAIMLHEPELVLHTGDWTYPDYQIPGDERLDWDDIKLAYRRRYNEPKMPQMLRSSVVDYVPDNHDGAYGHHNTSDWWATFDSATNTLTNHVSFTPIPTQAFANTMEAYDTYYPAWPLEAPGEGMYHSYTYGNAEVFFVDVRHCGNGLDSTFTYDAASNRWAFNPSPGQTLLGQQQMDWLKQGLANSTADWKFIVSGVMFNRQFLKIIQLGVAVQQMRMDIAGETGTGMRLAHSLAWNWAGYPQEQGDFLQYLGDNSIKDVIVLSGHVHTNVMDDGSNAGLPELNTGPVASYGPELTYYIDSFMQRLGFGKAIDSLWNGGGHGVENQNFKSGFGKVEIYGNDSIVMRTIDEDNFTVSSMLIPHSSKVTGIPIYTPSPTCVVSKVYPNPAGSAFQMELCNEYQPKETDRGYLVDIQGKITSVPLGMGKETAVDVSKLAAGIYILVYDYGDAIYTEQVKVER